MKPTIINLSGILRHEPHWMDDQRRRLEVRRQRFFVVAICLLSLGLGGLAIWFQH